MRSKILWLLLFALGTAQALAQDPPRTDPDAVPPNKAAPGATDPRLLPDDKSGGAIKQGAPLDLSGSKGVIKPAPVDPLMTRHPPDPGPNSTPVIKPKEDGSNNVVPK